MSIFEILLLGNAKPELIPRVLIGHVRARQVVTFGLPANAIVSGHRLSLCSSEVDNADET
jgi:hypothetical protein